MEAKSGCRRHWRTAGRSRTLGVQGLGERAEEAVLRGIFLIPWDKLEVAKVVNY